MRKGWIKDYRKELESDIWVIPPLYARVWNFLKYAVCFEEKKIPMREGTYINLMPGDYLTSLRAIAEAVGWYERGLWKQPNPKTIQDILSWMEKQEMIKIDHGRFNKQFTLITITNWDTYQNGDGMFFDFEDEGNTEETDEIQSADIKKNYNNLNNEKEKQEKEEDINVPLESCEKLEGRTLYKKNSYSDEFESFWSVYPRRVEKKKAYKAWRARLKEKVNPEDLITAANNYSSYCSLSSIEIRYIKHPSTFLGSDRPFEEFIDRMPEINENRDMPKNISDALNLCRMAESGSEREVLLW